jgi:hypothetical protein
VQPEDLTSLCLTRLEYQRRFLPSVATLNQMSQLQTLQLDTESQMSGEEVWFDDENDEDEIVLPGLRTLIVDQQDVLRRFSTPTLTGLTALDLFCGWLDSDMTHRLINLRKLEVDYMWDMPCLLELDTLSLLGSLTLYDTFGRVQLPPPQSPLWPRLTALKLQSHLFTDAHLRQCTALQHLSFKDNTKVTPGALAQTTQLTALSLICAPVWLQDYLTILPLLPQLKYLKLKPVRGFTEENCAVLEQLSSLQTLKFTVYGSQNATLDLQHFRALHTLKLANRLPVKNLTQLTQLTALKLATAAPVLWEDVAALTALRQLQCDQWLMPEDWCRCRNSRCTKCHV